MSSKLFHQAHDLMAGYDRGLARWQLAFDDMQVRATHATAVHAHQNFPNCWLRSRDVVTNQGIGLDRSGCF